jgi:serine/threonine protein kinase
MIGTLLNRRYRLDAEIGRGGMGVVYRAYDTLLERPVGLKILGKAGLGSEGRTRLLREARAVAQLNHRTIVSLYDVGGADEAGGASFIVMELVEGQSLFQRRPQSLDETLSIAGQICTALEHAHAHAIVHRDLKPENVLITPEGLVKLMDFGLARSVASRLSSEGAIAGTAFYLAPEQALGQEIDGRVDLYALGVILYELTTGRLPFTGDDLLTVISQHLHAPVVPPSTYNVALPPALDALIVQLLSKQPRDRPASAAQVRQALEHIASAGAEAVPVARLSLLDRLVRGRLVGREREFAEAKALWQRVAAAPCPLATLGMLRKACRRVAP